MTAPAAAAESVPYEDLAATGSVGLCDAKGRPVTHGSIHDKPFVWRAVSSTPATPPYDSEGRKATLVAYQPRDDANPSQWSGDIMTSTSSYTNPRYPMAQATALDFTLADFLNEFPARWDGMVQLRIYLGAPGQDTLNTSYPATDIKVTGDTWQVVRGDSVPCTDGSAEDSETVTTAPGGSGGGSGAQAGTRTGGGSGRSGSGSGSGAQADGLGSEAGGADSHGDPARSGHQADATGGVASSEDSNGWTVLGLVVAVTSTLGGVAFWRLRRKSV